MGRIRDITSERLGNALCLYHEDSDPSMAVYVNHNENGKEYYTYYCFACKASGHIKPHDVPDVLGRVTAVETDKPKPSLSKYWEDSEPAVKLLSFDRIPVFNERVVQFCTERNVQARALYNNNVRYNPVYNALVWQCLTFDGSATTAQVRFLDGKTNNHGSAPKILHLTVPNPPQHEPRYARIYNGFETWTGIKRNPDTIVVAESYLDGIAISSIDNLPNVGIMSILSTGFNQSYLGVIHRVAQSWGAGRIVLAFDWDKSGLTAEMVYARYLRSLGYTVERIASMVAPVKVDNGVVVPDESVEVVKVYSKDYLNKLAEVIRA